jgi:hypothetical protein
MDHVKSISTSTTMLASTLDTAWVGPEITIASDKVPAPSPSHQPTATTDTPPTTNIPAPKITKRVRVPNPCSKQVSQKPLIKNTKQAPAPNPHANHVPPKLLAKIFTHPPSQPRSTGTPLRDNATDKMKGPPVTSTSPSSSQSSSYCSNQSSSQSSPLHIG